MKRLLATAVLLVLTPAATARPGAKPEWPSWAEQPRILGVVRVGSFVTADEGSPMFQGEPDDRRPGCRLVRSRLDASQGCIAVEWVVNGQKRGQGNPFRIPAGATSVQAVVTIYVKEFDQLGRHVGYSQGSARTPAATVPTAARCEPQVACRYFEDRVRAWRGQGRTEAWIRKQREYRVWRQLGGG